MRKKTSPASNPNLPVSKQTAGGVAGAIVGGVIAGPVGAVAGAIAGTMMGNRAAKGKTLVSSETMKNAKTAVKAVKAKLPSMKRKAKPGSTSKPTSSKPATRKQAASKKAGAKTRVTPKAVQKRK